MVPAPYGKAAWKLGRDNKTRVRVKGELIEGRYKGLGIHYSSGEWGSPGWKINNEKSARSLKDTEAKWLYIDENAKGVEVFGAYWLGPSSLRPTIDRNLPDDTFYKEEDQFFILDTKGDITHGIGWEVLQLTPEDKVFLANYNRGVAIKWAEIEHSPERIPKIEEDFQAAIKKIKDETGYDGDGSPRATPVSRATTPPKRSLPPLPSLPLPPPPPPVVSQGGRRKSKRSKRSKRSKKTRRHSRK